MSKGHTNGNETGRGIFSFSFNFLLTNSQLLLILCNQTLITPINTDEISLFTDLRILRRNAFLERTFIVEFIKIHVIDITRDVVLGTNMESRFHGGKKEPRRPESSHRRRKKFG